MKRTLRLALPMVLLLLNPLLLEADDVPRDFFAGIVLDEPLPATFDTGQPLSLSGSLEDSGILLVRFLFSRADGVELDFWAWVIGDRFVREALFPHGHDGEWSLLVEADTGEDTLSPLGRFDGLQIERGEGPVMLPRRYFPLVRLDEPMPTRMTTGTAVHLAGHLDGLAPPAMLLFRFVSDAGNWDFHILALEERFERTLLLPREVEDAHGLIAYFGSPGGQLGVVAWYSSLDIEAGAEPAEVPRHFFNGLVLDEPLPVKWPLHRPVVVAGEVHPWVRGARLILAPEEGERRLLPFGLEEGRFRFPVRLTDDELGPVRLGLQIELQDDTNWILGSIVIEGVDSPVPDLEVGVLAVSLLAGQETGVPLLNRGHGAVELKPPRVEGPFSVEAWPDVLEPGESGEVVLSYSGSGDDRGLLTVLSDDPFRPRVTVALSGLERREASSDLVHLRANAEGRLEAAVDLREQDVVLALYASPLDAPDPEALYDILLDRTQVSGKPTHAPEADPLDTIELGDRRLERELALRLQQSGHWAGKPAAVQYEVGDRRSFTFDSDLDSLDQEIEARVAAVNERAVAFVQVDLREHPDNIDEEGIRTVTDQFAEDYPVLVGAFGAPSDVDGDGKIALLFTHLVHDIDRVVIFDAASVVPARIGGNGNMIDLMMLTPVASVHAYRTVLAHYFQHLINFNQHVLVRRSSSEEIWLNEGLSHVAQDLVAEHENENYALVRSFLRQPGGAGLSTGMGTLAKRGAAYLFVRSLVDLLGEEVLLRLVQTDRVDRENVETATGEGFADLIARWGAQLYVSGTGRSGHPRFNYRLASLHPPEGRGFPPPASVTYRLGEDPPALGVKPWGLQFLRVAGGGTASLSLQTEPQARLGAVALPVAKAADPDGMAADHFAGITFDPPLPLELPTGEPLVLQGTTADSVDLIHMEFFPDDGGVAGQFFLLVDEGRFSRTIYFYHEEAASYSLHVYVERRQPTPFAGSFHPMQLTRGQGPIQVPTRYFNRVRLDRPLPTSIHAGQPLHMSGEVSDPGATVMQLVLHPLDEGNTSEASRTLPLEAGRFDSELRFDEVPTGRYRLSMHLGPAGDLTYVGAVTSFEIRPMATSLHLAAEPAAFALHPNYPNPFNSRTHLSFSLPDDQPVELAVYDLLGQKLAVLVAGARESGFHSVEWDGRDDEGRLLASGSYLYRLRAGPHRGVGKLLLLR